MPLLPPLSQHNKIIIRVIALPLLLFVLAAGEWFRMDSPPELEERYGEVIESVQMLRNLRQEQGDLAKIELQGSVFTAREGLREFSSRAVLLQTEKKYTVVRVWLLSVTSVCALLTVFIAGGGLLRIRVMGRQALTSSEELLRVFRKGQKMLFPLLTALVILFLLTVICAVAYALLLVIISGFADDRSVGGIVAAALLFALVGLCLGSKVLWGIYKVPRSVFPLRPVEVVGTVAGKEDAPKLWSFVAEVADTIHAQMPDCIVLGLEESFFVTEHPVCLHDVTEQPQGRVLYLPLLYMAFMSRNEAAALIGRELAYFSGADREHSMKFSSVYSEGIQRLCAVRDVLANVSCVWFALPARMFGEYFLYAFHEALEHWSREYVLAADKVGSLAASPQDVAVALLRLAALALHVHEALEAFWEQGGTGDVFSLMRKSISEKGFGELEAYYEDMPAHPAESHPTLQERLAALSVPLTDTLRQRVLKPSESTLLFSLGLAKDESGSATRQDSTTTLAITPPLTKVIEASLFKKVQQEHQETIAELEEIGCLGQDTVSIYTVPRLLVVLIIVAGGFFPLFGILMPDFSLLKKSISVVVGLAVVAFGVCLGRKGTKLYVHMTATGILFGQLQEEIPWSAIEEVTVAEEKNNLFPMLITRLYIATDYTLPDLGSTKGITYTPDKREVALPTRGLAKMLPPAFYESLITHWKGGHARAELESIQRKFFSQDV